MKPKLVKVAKIIITLCKSTFRTLFYSYHILLLFLLLLHILVRTMGPYAARIFETYISGCVTVRAVELLKQVLWLLKFLQKKFWCSNLHVRSAIDQFSPRSIHFLVDLVGQS